MGATIGKVNWLDVLKGAFIASIASILTAVIVFLQAGHIPDCWACEGGWSVPVYAMIGTFLAYILKNLFTNSEGKMFTKEPSGI